MGRVTARRAGQSHLTAPTTVGDHPAPETLVVEEPLEIRLNGTPLTVTMRTPGSDVELAQGFLLTEGVITRPRRRAHRAVLPRVAIAAHPDDGLNTYNVLDVTLAPGVPMPDVDVTRNFYTTSSCGVCGKASIDAVGDHQPALAPATTRRWSPPRR